MVDSDIEEPRNRKMLKENNIIESKALFTIRRVGDAVRCDVCDAIVAPPSGCVSTAHLCS